MKEKWKDRLLMARFWAVMLVFWAGAAVLASLLEMAGCLTDSPIGPGPRW